ncbi:tyrosine--tRNA ligase [Candidatus Microgenomates bacterium]|nr:tyrosine--tRNA ligase [Candidatus Microgenomates bacterium CPR3]RIK51428.1 MAG: tyrosine--tRNA ligase [Candidatus Microgenomates bacterium]
MTNDLLTRGVENIIPNQAKLQALLDSGRKLNIYIGIDPTATRIHIGHAVPLRKLNEFASLGHNVTFLIGDFTALIGDTSDKDTERPILTSEEIKANFVSYKKLAEKVLDFNKVKVVYNSEWLSKLTFTDIVKLSQHFSAGDFVGRELIKKRLNAGKHVGLHELLYPVMQGYDSYHLDTDIQLGGTDQTFNMQAGRILQKDLRGKESFIIANGFLEGTDGRKMSKSWGNAIWLDDEPNEMYGKVMSLKDELIINYFTLATSVSREQIADYEASLKDGANPMDLKKALAHQIVLELHDENAANAAAEYFQKTVQNKELPQEIETVEIASGISASAMLFSQVFNVSKSESKRIIEQGGAHINDKKITNINENVDVVDNMVLKFGKRKIKKIKTI